MPFVRLGIVCFLIASFAYGFSVLVDRTETGRDEPSGCIPQTGAGCADLTRR